MSLRQSSFRSSNVKKIFGGICRFRRYGVIFRATLANGVIASAAKKLVNSHCERSEAISSFCFVALSLVALNPTWCRVCRAG
jgi:hypothetical protein